MKNSSRFFSNADCEYYPCHQKRGAFNCLFCYCPLYAMGKHCGGVFEYTQKGVKMCHDCMLPHEPEFYDVIVKKLSE